jgi:uncharacterized membrane-anchored protein
MRFPTLLRLPAADRSTVSGVVRLDRRTSNLTKRLRPGDIALIDHLDIDRASAEALVGCRVSAVVNVSQSVSGRYPNLGPEIIAAAGIPLVDNAGGDVFTALNEGDHVRIEDGTIYRDDVVIGMGEVLDAERVRELTVSARSGLPSQLEAFTANTAEYLKLERALLLDGVGVPDIGTRIDGRHVLVVVRGYDCRADLRSLRQYIKEHRPVLVGVDAGADVLVEAGYTPDLIVGDLESVSEPTLRSGAELVVHAHRSGRAPGLERVERLGLDAVVFPATGTSEDLAMLLADAKGASLIVAVGTHTTLVEFLDKGRSGMASTFLTRLRVGSKLVDAKGVAQLYRGRIRTWQVLLLVVAGLLALAVAVAATPAGDRWLSELGTAWDDLFEWARGHLP